MSLYNSLFGQETLAPVLLNALNLSRETVGRYRDCYLAKGEDLGMRIIVFTRNGGGNREDYEEVTRYLQAHPLYVRDWDEEYDCTYASYEFRVPESLAKALEKFDEEELMPQYAPMEKFKAVIEKLNSQ
jgi:hypothetical protein